MKWPLHNLNHAAPLATASRCHASIAISMAHVGMCKTGISLVEGLPDT